MQPFIYALVDPREPKHVRYVGMAVRNKRRPYWHARYARRIYAKDSYLTHWIRKIQSEGQEPSVLILETLREGAADDFVGFVEQCYIKSLREIGHHLTNLSAGGHGRSALHSDAARAKMASIEKTEAHREKLRLAAIARFQNPDARMRASDVARASFINDPSRREVLSAAAKRQWEDPTFRENRPQQQWSDAAREQIRNSNKRRKGIPKSPEIRANMLRARHERMAREKEQGIVYRFTMDKDAIARRIASYKATCAKRKAEGYAQPRDPCPPGCTCGKHTRSGNRAGNPCAVGCTCGRHRNKGK